MSGSISISQFRLLPVYAECTLTHVYTHIHTHARVWRDDFLMTRLRPSFERNKTEKRQAKALLYENFAFTGVCLMRWWELKSLPNVCIDLSCSQFMRARSLSLSRICLIISQTWTFFSDFISPQRGDRSDGEISEKYTI